MKVKIEIHNSSFDGPAVDEGNYVLKRSLL